MRNNIFSYDASFWRKSSWKSHRTFVYIPENRQNAAVNMVAIPNWRRNASLHKHKSKFWNNLFNKVLFTLLSFVSQNGFWFSLVVNTDFFENKDLLNRFILQKDIFNWQLYRILSHTLRIFIGSQVFKFLQFFKIDILENKALKTKFSISFYTKIQPLFCCAMNATLTCIQHAKKLFTEKVFDLNGKVCYT